MILEPCLTALDAPPPMRTIDWAIEYGFTETGQPYSDHAYPHLGAPGGPFDAFDCVQYFDIWLQWASRLGKTFAGQIVTIKQADRGAPAPMMFASADEKLALEVVNRTKAMIDHTGHLRHYSERQDRIDFKLSRVNVAWARSVSTLADKSARLLHCNEIDKWEHESTSKEADPLKLADDRCKDFVTFKRWKESTPALKSSSRIERGRLGSCNAAYFVPCPKCGRYQKLTLGDGKGERGCMTWEKNPAGRSEKDLARRTAVYICQYCGDALRDEHRGTMMRGGVWVPEGCGLDDERARECAATWREPGKPLWAGWKASPWVTGKPMRDGRDWGSQLSSLYAISRSWGDIAAEFIDSKERPQNLRNFKNQWLAETWQNSREECSWQQLGERLIVKGAPREVVPKGFSFITAGIDRQEDRFVWVVDAWGPDRASHTLDYGECETFDDLRKQVFNRGFAHADKGPTLLVQLALIDSGFHPKDIYDFCKRCCQEGGGRRLWPCKGSNIALGAPYKQNELGENSYGKGGTIIHVDTLTSQDWCTGQLRLDHRRDKGAATLFEASLWEHQDFLEQLLNDAAVVKLGTDNKSREVWERIDQNIPNDYRDCKRYSYTAMLRVTRGAPIRSR